MTAKNMREKAIEATENGIWKSIHEKASKGGFSISYHQRVVSPDMVKKLQEKGFVVEFVSNYAEIKW